MGIYRFRTPLFRQLSFISIIGIYICPLNLQPSNLLWLSWNSFLAALNVCTFVSLDPFQFCHLLELYGSQVSPLLRLYSVNCYRYLHPLLVLLDDIYITWGTLQAVKILDEPIFCQFYQKRKDKLRGCYAMIAVSQLTILGYFAVRLNAPSQHVILSVPLTFWEQVAVSRALYMLFYKEFCMCFLIHYIQCPFRNPPSDALANYKSDLAIKLFQMATIRCAFIAQLVFFILNYVVIITQTNT
ncbi:hypothetical protein TYRP_014383 [Tyrophagus putrescentiae]|nr:hypothetical protein TYRP_014383 [Tyrophagus putrescentiae]